MIIDMNLLNLRDFKCWLRWFSFFFVGDFVKHIIARHLYPSSQERTFRSLKALTKRFSWIYGIQCDYDEHGNVFVDVSRRGAFKTLLGTKILR